MAAGKACSSLGRLTRTAQGWPCQAASISSGPVSGACFPSPPRLDPSHRKSLLAAPRHPRPPAERPTSAARIGARKYCKVRSSAATRPQSRSPGILGSHTPSRVAFPRDAPMECLSVQTFATRSHAHTCIAPKPRFWPSSVTQWSSERVTSSTCGGGGSRALGLSPATAAHTV